jgi:hypothetical protein
MNNEFKKINNNNTTRYILEDGSSGGATTGGTSAGSISSFEKPMGGIQRRAGDDLIHQENKKSYKISHKPKNPVAKAHQTVGTGSGAHTDKTKTLPRKEKHKKPADMTMENFNAEYDDESGMSYGSLHTISRAANGLLGTIKEGDDLPEWCQEKISLAEDYLVTVWDYLQSEKEQGVAEGSEQVFKVIAVDKSNYLGGKEEMTVKADSIEDLFSRLSANDWYPLEINGVEVVAGKRLKQGVAEEGYGKHPSQRVDPRTGKKYVPPKSPLGQGVAEGLPQTLRKVVPGHAKREIDKKMDAGKFGKTDADKDANFQRYKKIQDKLKEQGVAEGADSYMESLASTLAEKLDPNAEPEVWVQDFQKANPNKYHQFKNKTPQKKAQMAVAARRDARLKK